MSKYGKLRNIMAEERDFIKEQSRLHDKHDYVPDNAVIVEKSTAVRSTLAFVRGIGKTAAGIIFIILAAIGIITLIYPTTRAELVTVLQGMILEIKSMI